MKQDDRKKYLEDKGVTGISYNPFTPSQMRLLNNWLTNQCDYFRILESEHPTEIYYSGMLSAAKLIRDKFILEGFISTLDEQRPYQEALAYAEASLEAAQKVFVISGDSTGAGLMQQALDKVKSALEGKT